MTSLENITEYIRHSSLPTGDQEDLLALVQGMRDKELGDLADLLRDRPDLLQEISALTKKKKDAMFRSSPDLWQEVLDREIQIVNELNDGEP